MSDDIKKGLLGIVVDETTISQVMPDINSLTYRGYAVQDLCEKCSFEEVAYLILNKELPNQTKLKKFKKELEENRNITINLREIVKHMPKKSHPMDVARTVVSVMGLEDKDTNNNSPTANMRKAIRIFAKTPTAIAAFFRARQGKNVIPPKKKLTFSENFFYMCFGKVPRKEVVKAFDVSLILYAEHSFNVSTFTARTITSSLSDIHGAITGAIASLKGPLHGGANEDVIAMLEEIGRPDEASSFLKDAIAKKRKIMGFGHREYRVKDPRATILQAFAEELFSEFGKDEMYEVAKALEEEAISKLGPKGIFPNVDFYSGLVYRKLGIPRDLFTPVFAISRVAGWLAHWREQLGANRIFRPSQIYEGEKIRNWQPLESR